MRNKFIVLYIILLLLLLGCDSKYISIQTRYPESNPSIMSTTSKKPDVNDYLPMGINVNDLCEISVVGLTADTAIGEELLTSSGKETLQEFIKNLEVSKVPISQQEYETCAFISGKICISFSWGKCDYTIVSDKSSEIFVICVFQGEDFYIGEFFLDDKYYEEMVSLIYNKER